MALDTIRILLDFGLVVLIWIVQLVIYPSFNYYTPEDLLKWHDKYTGRVTFVVLPLMLGQLLVAGLQLWLVLNAFTIISIVLIGLLWASTFLRFVPMHNELSSKGFDPELVKNLTQKNWERTFLWSLLFCISFFYFINQGY